MLITDHLHWELTSVLILQSPPTHHTRKTSVQCTIGIPEPYIQYMLFIWVIIIKCLADWRWQLYGYVSKVWNLARAVVCSFWCPTAENFNVHSMLQVFQVFCLCLRRLNDPSITPESRRSTPAFYCCMQNPNSLDWS